MVGFKWDIVVEIICKNGIKIFKECVFEIVIRNCFKEVVSLRFIVILVVSFGQFGFLCDFCVKVILDIVVDFCKVNLICNLLEIYLVNYDLLIVKVFVDEMRN